MSRLIQILSTKKLQPKTCKLLNNEGIILTTIPFIEIKKRESAVLNEQLKVLSEKGLVAIFTSKNAVNAVFSKIKNAKKWQAFCLSGQTKKVLLNFIPEQQIIDEATNGQELSEKIIIQKPNNPIIFFCGDKRHSTISEILTGQGIPLEEVIVYDTVLHPKKIQNNFDGILFFSPSAVESFFSVNKITDETTLFSIGKTTKEALLHFTQNEIISPEFPSEESLFEKMLSFFF